RPTPSARSTPTIAVPARSAAPALTTIAVRRKCVRAPARARASSAVTGATALSIACATCSRSSMIVHLHGDPQAGQPALEMVLHARLAHAGELRDFGERPPESVHEHDR